VVPALIALGLVAAICVLLIVYEVFRHRQSRAWIRSRRGAFSIEEAQARNDDMRERRPRRGAGNRSPHGDPDVTR
jgi:hypothetical protein